MAKTNSTPRWLTSIRHSSWPQITRQARNCADYFARAQAVGRGHVCLQQGQLNFAPDAVLPYQHRGEVYREQGDLKKAVRQLTKALELVPGDAADIDAPG